MRRVLPLLAMLAACAFNAPQTPPPPIMIPPNPVQQPVPATSQPAPNPHPGLVTGSEVAKDIDKAPAPKRPVAGKITRSVNEAKAPPDAPDSPCTTAADCALTLIPPAGCCPTLCAPRPITKSRARALDSATASCARAAVCSAPSCGPRLGLVPACVTNHCIAQPAVR